MIATDLNWFNRNRDYQINDSQYIEVFESHDLVNWSPQRHVKVAPDNAGNAFAPEAYWDDSIGAYVVFWAQAMWRDPVNRTNPGNQQMWYTTTRDFRTFSPPAVWQDPYPQSRIDTTVIKVGDWFYRFTKNEAGNAGSDVFSEKHTQPARHQPRQLDAGRPVDRPAARGSPTRATRARWCSRPTRATPPAPSSSTSGRTATPTAAATSSRAAPTSRRRRGRPRRRGSPTPAPCGTAPSRRSRCASGTASSGSPNPDVATTTELALPAPTVPEGDAFTATATVRAADGYETGGRVRFSRAGLAGDRLPRRRRGLGHRARPRRRRRRRRSRPSTWATSS